jgi:hypothetical protein
MFISCQRSSPLFLPRATWNKSRPSYCLIHLIFFSCPHLCLSNAASQSGSKQNLVGIFHLSYDDTCSDILTYLSCYFSNELMSTSTASMSYYSWFPLYYSIYMYKFLILRLLCSLLNMYHRHLHHVFGLITPETSFSVFKVFPCRLTRFDFRAVSLSQSVHRRFRNRRAPRILLAFPQTTTLCSLLVPSTYRRPRK